MAWPGSIPITHVVYVHGFRSSPQSGKARRLHAALTDRARAAHCAPPCWWCPQLPPSPREAMALLRAGIASWPAATSAVVGSSLGGCYATALAEHAGCRAVLLNPAVDPARDLAAHVGPQTLWHDPTQQWDFTAAHLAELHDIVPTEITQPRRYHVVIAKGDELLDWRDMQARYAGACIQLLEGGDHALSDFDDHLEPVMRFLGRPRATD